MADEDFEEEELNYRKICKDIIRTLNKIKRELWIFNKFKLPDYQKKDLIDIVEKLKKLNYSEYNSQTFVKLMDISCQVEDLLEKMNFILGDLIKNINNLSKTDKKKIYSYFKIEKITPEFKKLSNKFNLSLPQMSKLIKEIMNKYLSYYKEE
jgi:hypothetical protein